MQLKIGSVRPGEGRALAWSFAYFFCLLAGYYVLRPVRDEMGLAGGIKNLPSLFTATFVVMLAVLPFFGANLVLFWLLLTFNVAMTETAKVFFVWLSVFNLFAVSVFWSFMADLYA